MIHSMESSLTQLYLHSEAQTRSISPENRTGEKNAGGRAAEGSGAICARDLGVGWKISPSLDIASGECLELANIEGPGCIQHIWMTLTGNTRHLILRFYWDEQDFPSVECPAGDFFASAYTTFSIFRPVVSIPITVNPGNAYNSYWQMPFEHHCRITMENISLENARIYYQITYSLQELNSKIAYFHAQFRRVNPLPYKEVYTIIDNIKGKGQYVGTYLAWGVHNNNWWGEGEVKFYMDGDEYPTICGTGTEDYFCGSYNFENKESRTYQEYCTPYAGVPHIVKPDGLYQSQMRFSMYRWHIVDPIRFSSDLRVTIQALGWRPDGRYLPLQDDIASVAYWYQTLPHNPFPPLPDKDYLEII